MTNFVGNLRQLFKYFDNNLVANNPKVKLIKKTTNQYATIVIIPLFNYSKS